MLQRPSSPTTAMADFCAIEGCRSCEYPLHYIYYQNRFIRLCTNCVIKLNPGNFCSHCLSPLYVAPRSAVVHCSQCRMVAHLNCLQNPNFASRFLCPSCSSKDGFRFRWFSHESGTLINDFALRGLLLGASLVYEMNKKAVLKMTEEVEEKFDAMLDSELKAKLLVEACKKGIERKTKRNAVVSASPKKVVKTERCVREFDQMSNYHEMNVDGGVRGFESLVSLPQISTVTGSSQAKPSLVSPDADALNQISNNAKMTPNGGEGNQLLPQKEQGLTSHGLTEPKSQSKRKIVKHKACTSEPRRIVKPKNAMKTKRCVREFEKMSCYLEMNVGSIVNNLVSQPREISSVTGSNQAKQGLVGPEADALNLACNNWKIEENMGEPNHLVPQKEHDFACHGLKKPKFKDFEPEIVKCKNASTSLPERGVVISGSSSANLIPKPSAMYMHN